MDLRAEKINYYEIFMLQVCSGRGSTSSRPQQASSLLLQARLGHTVLQAPGRRRAVSRAAENVRVQAAAGHGPVQAQARLPPHQRPAGPAEPHRAEAVQDRQGELAAVRGVGARREQETEHFQARFKVQEEKVVRLNFLQTRTG